MKIKITKEQFEEMIKNPEVEYTIGIFKDEKMATKKSNAYGAPVIYQGSKVTIVFMPFDEDEVLEFDMPYEEALEYCQREYRVEFEHIFHFPKEKWRTPDMYASGREYFTANELWEDISNIDFIVSYSIPKSRKIHR